MVRTFRHNYERARQLEPQRCEYPDCDALAEGWVEAAWSIADFVRYEGCFDHLQDMRDQLAKRTVYGLTGDVAVDFYE